jgi:N-acetylneuraminic acid mutarotase
MQPGLTKTSRTLDRALVSALCLASSLAVAACTPNQPAASADRAAPTSAAEGAANGEHASGALISRFAGVMPRGLTTVGATSMGDSLYLVGGYFGPPHDYSKEFQTGNVSRMNLSTGAWEDLAAVSPIQSPAVTGDGRYLYKIGGLTTLNSTGQPTELRSVADVERFDPAQNRWEPLPSLPEPRSSHQAVIVGSTLYVVGGWSLEGGMNDNTWRETMLTAELGQPTLQWQSVKLPFQVRAQGLVAHAGKLYVLGGLAPEGSTGAVRRYDIASKQWSDGPKLPDDTLTARGAVYKGQLYANGADGTMYRLSADETKWEAAGKTQYSRLFHEMVSTERGPIVLAGIPDNNRGGRIRVIERLSEEPAPAGLIMNLASDSPAKNRQGAFMWSQQLFLFGGNNSLSQHDFEQNNFVNHATRLDLGALEWRPVPEFPAARQSMQALVVGKDEASALVIGGFGYAGNVLSTSAEVYRHEIMKREWVAAPGQKLPEGLSQFGIAAWKDALWIVGGMNFDGSREQNDQIRHTTQILKLDLSRPDGKFEDAGVALQEPRRAFAGAVLDGTYYVVGGLRDNFQGVEACEAIDLEAKRSKALECPSVHRLGAELVAIGGKLYLVGGSVASGDGQQRKPTTVIETFDPKTGGWAALPAPMPLDTAEQLRAFNYDDQLLLYSAQRNDASVQVALLDPAALAAGRTNYTRVNVTKPVQ